MGKTKKLHKLDTLLIEWRASGSPDLFLAEVNRYAYRRVIMKVKDHGHAEDIAAQSMVYVWRHITKFDPARSSIANWVRMTTDSMLNGFLEMIRYRDKELIAESIDPQDVDSSDDSHVFIDTSTLPDNLRTIANSLLFGYSIAETATQLGVKPATLRKRLERVREKMSHFLHIDPIIQCREK